MGIGPKDYKKLKNRQMYQRILERRVKRKLIDERVVSNTEGGHTKGNMDEVDSTCYNLVELEFSSLKAENYKLQ